MKRVFKNYTQRYHFLQNIIDNEIIPDKQELKKILYLASNKSKEIRWMVCKALVNCYYPEGERALIALTYDLNLLVRVNAIDSLCIGRTESTLVRLKELMLDDNRLTRSYAIESYFTVWTNIKGYHEKSMYEYMASVQKLYETEVDNGVKSSYDRNAYLAGNKKSLNILYARVKADTKEDWKMILGNLKYIRNVQNKEEINAALESISKDTELKREIRKRAKDILKEKVKLTVLIMDRKNDYLSQMLEKIGNESYDINFYSCGKEPSKEMKENVVISMEEYYGVDIRKYQYPKYEENIWWFDVIIPIGIKIESKDYPFQKVLHSFEKYESKDKETPEQAQKMLEKILSSIGNCILNELRLS